MLFEQSGSVWLWWVCISRLESEGGRGGRAFCKKHSALFRPRLIGQCSAISTALCGLVRSEIHVGGGLTLAAQRSKKNAKLTNAFLGHTGKTAVRRPRCSDFSNLARPPC